jgi:hypothetical protein
MEIHKNKYKNKIQNMTVYKGNKLIKIPRKIKVSISITTIIIISIAQLKFLIEK